MSRAWTVGDICDELKRHRRPLILIHRNPDGDAIGSSAALLLLLREMGAEPSVGCPDARLPERMCAFAVSPILCGEEVLREVGNGRFDAIYTTDVPSPMQLGMLSPLAETGKICLMIDHHAKGDPFAPGLIRPDAAAAGEIVLDIADELLRRGEIPSIPQGVFDALYLSVATDTGCFRYSNVTEHTFFCGARFLREGVDTARINRMAFDEKSPYEIEAEKIVYNRLRLLLDGRLSVAVLDNAAKNGVPDEYFEGAVDIARSVRGAVVSCAIKERSDEPGTFRVSARSNGDADVSLLCAIFGGGGHRCAAGCTVRAASADEAATIVADAASALLDGPRADGTTES